MSRTPHLRMIPPQPLVFLPLLSFLFLLIGVSVHGTENPEGRVEIERTQESTLYRGEKFSFSIKLMSTTWFSGTPRFETPDVSYGMLYRVQDRPVQGTENSSGQDYTTQLYEFWFFPNQSGTLTVPPITVTFSTPVPAGNEAIIHTLSTSSFAVEVQDIPGIPTESEIVATPHLTAKQSWHPSPADGHVGDALTRTIRIRAGDMAAIFLPEITFSPVTGASVYPEPAEVKDFNERGEATGQRTESATYLFEQGGEHTLPDIRLSWWNSERELLEEIVLPGTTIRIKTQNAATGTGQKATGPDTKPPRNIMFITLFLVGCMACLILLVIAGNRILKLLRKKKEVYLQSEKAYFRALEGACRKNQELPAYNRLYFWSLKRDSHTRRTLKDLAATESVELLPEMTELERRLFSPLPHGSSPWNGSRLLKAVKAVRKNMAQHEKQKKPLLFIKHLN